MKKWIWIFAVVSAIVRNVYTQGVSDFFEGNGMMSIGVYYYPEAWPENQWARDIRNIRRLGFEFVHMGEFAWAFMEPEEGRYVLGWLEKNVRLAAEQGLKVILCTPSPAPPVWLVRGHPEVLMVDNLGRSMQHGTRTQACWTVPRYRDHVARIIAELGRKFGTNPAVWGWQIDNEISHYGKNCCYCDFCQNRFREWLKQKYGTIGKLNTDWGCAFWSQMYQGFDQIRIPNQAELVAQMNPHALLDFNRWFAEEAADYIRFQATELRKYCRNQWVTTNFMSLHEQVYPALSGKDLDAMTWTVYPVHGNLNEGPLGFRLGNGTELAFMHDFMRPMNGFEGIMELQPGQVNWGDINPQPYPGAVRMWILQAFASGADLVCTYRYRQPLFGAELYHRCIVETDGVTPSTGGKEYSQAANDMLLLRKHRQPNAAMPKKLVARRTAFLYHFDNRWDMANHLQTTRWNTMGHLLKYYKALKSLGCPVDVIGEERDFSAYPFLVAPAYQLLDSALVARWTRYAEKGGHLILSCRTGQKDRRGQLWEGSWAGPILKLIGARIPFYDLLPEAVNGKVQSDARTHAWGAWAESLDPESGTAILARYADQFYMGNAAAVTRKLGKGSVTYVGVETLDGEMERDLVRGVFERAGVAVENFESQFLVDWRDGFWVATNFTEKTLNAPIPPGSTVLLGSRELGPAGVAVWKE